VGTRASTDLLARQLLRAARVEHRLSSLIEILQSRITGPQPALEQQLELLEQRRAEALEEIIELQRLLEPRPHRPAGSGRIG
jgi:hypothetical protein